MKKDLQFILENLASKVCSISEDGYFKDSPSLIINQTKQAIREYFIELIQKDEKDYGSDWRDGYNQRAKEIRGRIE